VHGVVDVNVIGSLTAAVSGEAVAVAVSVVSALAPGTTSRARRTASAAPLASTRRPLTNSGGQLGRNASTSPRIGGSTPNFDADFADP
jgi:hypothetical protein